MHERWPLPHPWQWVLVSQSDLSCWMPFDRLFVKVLCSVCSLFSPLSLLTKSPLWNWRALLGFACLIGASVGAMRAPVDSLVQYSTSSCFLRFWIRRTANINTNNYRKLENDVCETMCFWEQELIGSFLHTRNQLFCLKKKDKRRKSNTIKSSLMSTFSHVPNTAPPPS